MANIANNAFRSRLAQTAAHRTGAAGFHKNPQAFDHMAGTRVTTRQAYLKKNWHYLSDGMMAHAGRLTTKMETINGQQEIDTKTGQFAMAL